LWAVRSYHRSRGSAPKTRSRVPRTITEIGLRSTKRANTSPSITASLWTVIEKAYRIEYRVTLKGLGQAAYAGLVDWTLDPRPGNATSFERSRQEIFELRKQHVSGFVLNGLGRLFGHHYRYQVVQFYSTMDALQAASPGSPIPQLQAFGEAHPPSAYASTPLSAEVYEVVQRLL